MTNRTAAVRYARALLDVATKESVDLEAIGQDIDGFITFLKGQPTLNRLLMNPAVPVPRKRAAMQEITKLSGLRPVVSKLLVLLADRDRLGLLHELSATYHALLAERQNVVRAEVTTAEPLSRDQLDAIEKKLASVTGKRVSMTTKVRTDLLGGVVARVGSTVYDASIATHLKKIRARLAD
jgi:F-type H+-transporting ATPase subunit delta